MFVLTKVLTFIGLFGAATMLHAQAKPTATRGGDLKIGGGFTTARSDYDGSFKGGAAYIDYDFTQHLGIEGQFHFVKGGPNGLYEKAYEAGGRYFRTYGRFVPYAKIMYGRGVFNFPPYFDAPNSPRANLAYNLWATGGGVDYKATSRIYARADFEYQSWSSFPSPGSSGLTPMLFTFGAAYHFQ
jgi:hypothetical protein